jgi:hypothetical protein
MDPLEEIRKLYYRTTRATIDRDLLRAVELLKTMPTEEERDRAQVYMQGLAEMRKEFGPARGRTRPGAPRSGRGSSR